MVRARLFLLVLLALLCLPLASQEERPYFSLSSNRTFAPGEKPAISLWSNDVDSLEFRVYRVKDPVQFFQQLEDVHRFGGQGPALPRERTLLERFARWKREWRWRVRDFLRQQFTPESRARIRDWLVARRQEPLRRVSTYAQVPFLNPQQVVAVWQQGIPAGARRWASQTITIPVEDKGLYLVEAVHGELRAYTIVLVTGIAVVTKSSPGRVLAYVADRQSGEPQAGSEVLVWSDKEEVAQTASDASGVVEVPLDNPNPESTLVLAQQGPDFAIDSLYSWYLNSDPAEHLVGYVYSDRPVYRPGHTVHWKGILRTQAGATYKLPDGGDVQVQVLDPDNKPVFQKTVRVSSMGTVNGELTLPVSAALGYYSLDMKAGPSTVRGGFHVEEYKKPEYEVRVTPSPRRVLQGEPITATIEARYYFGEPVARAKVTYVVHRSRYWLFPQYYDEYEFGEDDEEGFGDYGGEQILEEIGELAADGKLVVSIPTAVSERRWDMRYRIEARVTDASNREISGSGAALATYGSFLVNVQAGRYVYGPGESARLSIEAKDYDGHPIATSFQVHLLSYTWRRDKTEEKRIRSVASQTDSNGLAKLELPLGAGGSFSIQVTAPTPEGREIEDRTYVWVTGGAADWYGGRRERLQIVPDKQSYRPGDVAKILIVTGTPDAHLLVTTEGRELFTRQTLAVTGPTATVEIPVKSDYAPNFFVSAVFVRENQLYQGSKSINVPPTEHELKVEVSSNKDTFRPGESGTLTISARDYQDKPVSAEFSLGVVDEAIYAIRPELAQDMVKFFYGRTYSRVHTDSSLSYYFHGASGKRVMRLAGGRGGRASTELAQLKPQTLVQPEVRKAFPDTILWLADVRTGADGRAQTRVTYPDALTTWRATARGLTLDTRVGSAVQSTVVRKNVILRLAAPRFFTQGDEVVISAIVHNYLERPKTARVSLDAEGLEILEGQTTDIDVPSRGEVQVDFRVRALHPGSVKLLGKALTDEESDALELTLPVNPYGVKLSQAYAGSLTDPTAQLSQTLAFPPAIVAGSRVLELRVQPSVAGAIFGALEFLTSYPYGCTEQTMSSFLPNVVVLQALKELGVESNVDKQELDKKIRAGLDRLYDFQHPDGGWGWWQTDDSHVFMTAYVISGLVQARDAGLEIRGPVVEKGAGWLQSQIETTQKVEPDLRAFVAYALVRAGKMPKELLDALWEKRSDMTAMGLAQLGLALEAAGDTRARQAAGELEARALTDNEEAYWKVDRDTLMGFDGDSSPEATAYAVKLLARQRPQSQLLPKAALWLVNHRDQGYYWVTTKQTAMVVFGLTDYLKQSGELRPNFRVRVWVNDREVLSQRFGPRDALALQTPVIRLTEGQLQSSSNRLRIEKQGEGVVYWSARLEYFSAAEKLERQGTVSLNLLREYFRLTPQQKGDKIVFRLDPLSGDVKPGDVLAVRLTLNGGPSRYLLIEDPIPAGTEFIERDDLYEFVDRPAWWQYWFTRREFHDDHAAFFQTYAFRSQTQYFYLLKVVNPGRFRVSPARVQPMYQPQRFSTSGSQILVVR